MPVVFLCQNCRSRLKVTRRKIGATIACPRCESAMVVPTQEAANVSLAMANAEDEPQFEDLFPEFAVFDEPRPAKPAATSLAAVPPPPTSQAISSAPPKPDKPKSDKRSRKKSGDEPAPPVETQRVGSENGPLAPPPPSVHANGEAKHADVPPPAPPAADRRSVQGPPAKTASAPKPYSSGDKLLISRRIIYFQAGLIGFLALLGLVGGFLIGRAVGPVEQKPPPVTNLEPTYEITGSIKYRLVGGDSKADFLAVAIALPVDKNAAIPVDGLGPLAERNAGHRGEMAIEELGGAYARTLANGNFTLRLPRPGRYHLLLISNQTQRAKDRKIYDSDLQELRRYFSSPDGLIGQHRYLWVSHEVRDRLTLLHIF
jgi:hypothetical protein